MPQTTPSYVLMITDMPFAILEQSSAVKFLWHVTTAEFHYFKKMFQYIAQPKTKKY